MSDGKMKDETAIELLKIAAELASKSDGNTSVQAAKLNAGRGASGPKTLEGVTPAHLEKWTDAVSKEYWKLKKQGS